MSQTNMPANYMWPDPSTYIALNKKINITHKRDGNKNEKIIYIHTHQPTINLTKN